MNEKRWTNATIRKWVRLYVSGCRINYITSKEAYKTVEGQYHQPCKTTVRRLIKEALVFYSKNEDRYFLEIVLGLNPKGDKTEAQVINFHRNRGF